MSEKHFLKGGAREFVFDDGNSVINVYVDIDDAIEKGAITESKSSGRKFLNVSIAKRKENTEWGDTHYTYFKPFNKKDDGSKSKPNKKKSGSKRNKLGDDVDDLPF